MTRGPSARSWIIKKAEGACSGAIHPLPDKKNEPISYVELVRFFRSICSYVRKEG